MQPKPTASVFGYASAEQDKQPIREREETESHPGIDFANAAAPSLAAGAASMCLFIIMHCVSCLALLRCLTSGYVVLRCVACIPACVIFLPHHIAVLRSPPRNMFNGRLDTILTNPAITVPTHAKACPTQTPVLGFVSKLLRNHDPYLINDDLRLRAISTPSLGFYGVVSPTRELV